MTVRETCRNCGLPVRTDEDWGRMAAGCGETPGLCWARTAEACLEQRHGVTPMEEVGRLRAEVARLREQLAYIEADAALQSARRAWTRHVESCQACESMADCPERARLHEAKHRAWEVAEPLYAARRRAHFAAKDAAGEGGGE